MSITVSVNGLTITGEADDIRQLLGMSFSSPTKRGPGRPPKAAIAWPVAAQDGVKPVKPSRPVSPQVQKARKLQGEYLGLTRTLSAAQKATVKKIRADKGPEAAVKAAREMSEAAKKKAGK